MTSVSTGFRYTAVFWGPCVYPFNYSTAFTPMSSPYFYFPLWSPSSVAWWRAQGRSEAGTCDLCCVSGHCLLIGKTMAHLHTTRYEGGNVPAGVNLWVGTLPIQLLPWSRRPEMLSIRLWLPEQAMLARGFGAKKVTLPSKFWAWIYRGWGGLDTRT